MLRFSVILVGAMALAACTSQSDAEFYASFCTSVGHQAGSATFEKCVADKETEILKERNRRVRPPDPGDVGG
jgi:hypothetical protein